MNGIRVNERHLEAEEALARLFVDQVGAGAGELGQRDLHVAYLVRDVVHARAPLRQEPADGRVLAEGLQQLHPPLADAQRGGPDALALDRGPMLDLRTEQALVGLDGPVEVFDRDPEMVDSPRLHAGDAIRA